VGPGEVHGDPRPRETLDRLAVEGLRGAAVGDQGARAGLHTERPRCPAGVGPLDDALDRLGGDVGSVAADGRLDHLEQGPTGDAEVVVGARRPGGLEGGRVAADPVEEQGSGVLAPADAPALAASGHGPDVGIDQGQ
jgi:hypothetical protein